MSITKIGNVYVALAKTINPHTKTFLAGYFATGKTVQEALANCFTKIITQ